MRQELNPLVVDLLSGKLDNSELTLNFFIDIDHKEEYVLNQIRKGILNKDPIEIEEAVTLIYACRLAPVFYVTELCQLLQLSWHKKHEDIAMLLKELSDPNTVDCLYSATELEFNYLSYDDSYQFARKCIKALASIGNEKAIEKLRLLTNSRIKEIAEYALKELSRKDL